MIYDQLHGIPDAMQLERMVAGAIGIKDYKRPKGDNGNAFQVMRAKAQAKK